MKRLLPLTLVTTLFAATIVQAETLSIPLGQQAVSQQLDLPQRGTSTSAVQQRHGAPTTRHAAVGQPPISRWDYPGFSVYFEHDKVIHSVRQHIPTGN
ncbi:phosphodiesterase [Pseudomonas sp. MYb185]|uniref:phosphodiesterase n=1 Tax=Pseudomonas sp. MYb185 TaxID=1848729 RepID=UPI000CFD3941|nr:phosphodiesterase [Pseudomonas sp. MYb185]PRB82201.1 phosphodiesterase [Pseudomonas sp. MYb185]